MCNIQCVYDIQGRSSEHRKAGQATTYPSLSQPVGGQSFRMVVLAVAFAVDRQLFEAGGGSVCSRFEGLQTILLRPVL